MLRTRVSGLPISGQSTLPLQSQVGTNDGSALGRPGGKSAARTDEGFCGLSLQSRAMRGER